MADGIRTGNPRGFPDGRSSKFRVGSRVPQTPDRRPEDISSETL